MKMDGGTPLERARWKPMMVVVRERQNIGNGSDGGENERRGENEKITRVQLYRVARGRVKRGFGGCQSASTTNKIYAGSDTNFCGLLCYRSLLLVRPSPPRFVDDFDDFRNAKRRTTKTMTRRRRIDDKRCTRSLRDGNSSQNSHPRFRACTLRRLHRRESNEISGERSTKQTRISV